MKNGHDKEVPSDIIDAVRSCDPEATVSSFETTVVPMIKDSLRKLLILALLSVLDADNKLDESVPISWLHGYTKKAVLSASSIDLTYLLTSLVRLSVLEIDNNE